MKLQDIKLQEAIERGKEVDPENPDEKAYGRIFHALSKKPAIEISDDFALRVVSALERKQSSTVIRDYFWLAAGIVFLLTAGIVTILYFGASLDLGFLAEYKQLAIFSIVMIVLLQWVDTRFIIGRARRWQS